MAKPPARKIQRRSSQHLFGSAAAGAAGAGAADLGGCSPALRFVRTPGGQDWKWRSAAMEGARPARQWRA